MEHGDLPPGIPAPGELLSGKYRVERVLGKGGMGVVLAAQHVTLGQRVAIKLLLPEVAKIPEAAARFVREARASTNLRSEHIARVVDVGTQDNGAPYMVMEYLEGKDLHQLASAPVSVPVASAVEYVLQAAEALAEAHSLGIVHRDLKPANLFLTSGADGSALVKVLDFGISKANLPGESGITATEAVLGSPGYMAPEQIRSAKYVDQRADVWGMGITLYELLTGGPPFDGESIAAVSVQIVLENPKLVHERRPDVPEGLSRVVQRCLEKEPAKRYQNMAELAAALQPFAPSDSSAMVERIRRIARGSVPFAATIAASDPDLRSQIAAGTDGNWETSKPTSGRGRVLALGLAGALVLAVVLAGAFTWGRSSADRSVAGSAPIANPPAERGTAAASGEHGSPSVEAARAEPASSAEPAPPAPATTAAPAKSTSPSSHKAPSRATACPRGESMSSGHCCPSGLVWQKTRCDRPLAVNLP